MNAKTFFYIKMAEGKMCKNFLRYFLIHILNVNINLNC